MEVWKHGKMGTLWKPCFGSVFKHMYQQESPPAWTQEAYGPPCSEYSFCCPILADPPRTDPPVPDWPLTPPPPPDWLPPGLPLPRRRTDPPLRWVGWLTPHILMLPPFWWAISPNIANQKRCITKTDKSLIFSPPIYVMCSDNRWINEVAIKSTRSGSRLYFRHCSVKFSTFFMNLRERLTWNRSRSIMFEHHRHYFSSKS